MGCVTKAICRDQVAMVRCLLVMTSMLNYIFSGIESAVSCSFSDFHGTMKFAIDIDSHDNPPSDCLSFFDSDVISLFVKDKDEAQRIYMNNGIQTIAIPCRLDPRVSCVFFFDL